MDKEKIRTVVEDNDWQITIWNFQEEVDAEAFILSHFETKMKDWNIDYYWETWLDQSDIDALNFYIDNYSIYLTNTYLLFKNPNWNDWTKEFRGDSRRSRQEDRTTSWDWWEV